MMESSIVKMFHDQIEMDICTRLDRLESIVNTLVAQHGGGQQSFGPHAQIEGSVSTSLNGEGSFSFLHKSPEVSHCNTANNLPVTEEGDQAQVINMEDILM